MRETAAAAQTSKRREGAAPGRPRLSRWAGAYATARKKGIIPPRRKATRS